MKVFEELHSSKLNTKSDVQVFFTARKTVLKQCSLEQLNEAIQWIESDVQEKRSAGVVDHIHTVTLAHLLGAYSTNWESSTQANQASLGAFVHFANNYICYIAERGDFVFCGEEFDYVCNKFASCVTALKWEKAYIGTLLVALDKRTGGDDGLLTTIHTDVLQLCVTTNSIGIANNILLRGKFVKIPPVTNEKRRSLVACEVQKFHYLACIVHCIMRRYEDAYFSAIQCLTVPSSAFNSSVQGAAFRKLTLLNLIVKGSINIALPKYVNPNVLKNCSMKNHEAYERFLHTVDAGVLKDISDAANDMVIYADGNYGLAQVCVERWLMQRIGKAVNIYCVMTTSDLNFVASTLSLTAEETLKYIKKMNEIGLLSAQFDQVANCIYFHNTDVINTHALETNVSHLEVIAKRVAELDKHLAINKDYIKNLLNQVPGKQAGNR